MTTGNNGVLVPAAGDVLLLERPDSKDHRISKIIREMTGSPYSHTLVVMDTDRVAQATPGEGGASDIQVLDRGGLDALVSAVERIDLFRPNPPVASRDLLDQAVQDFVDRAEAPETGRDPTVMFSMGTATTVAALQLLQRRLADAPESDQADLKRWQDAYFWSLENGDSRLFCSEFAHVVLDRAGQRPELPPMPSLSTGTYPTDEPVREAWIGDWFRDLWGRLKTRVSDQILHDPDAIKTIDEEWSCVLQAYECERKPARLTIANFFTPADFSWSPSLTRIARRDEKHGPDWFRIDPMPTDGSRP